MFLSKELLENKEKLFKEFENEKIIVNEMIKSQEEKRERILNVLKKYIDYIKKINVSDVTEKILWTLDNLRIAFLLYEVNIYLSNILLKILTTFQDIEEIDIDDFNSKYLEINKIILNNIIKIDSILKEVLEKSFDIEKQEEEIDLEYKVDYPEETLIISEKEGKVILPFSIESLIKEKDEKDINEVINEKYTVPIDTYKNTARSRFKEAFKLMRKKEKESIKNSLALGTELFFNYNLHPAIISACRNLDELDIYLDCLEENEIDKFDCFKIVFDVAPVLVKKKK